MEVAIIGILGVIAGIFINEYVRRKNRIENYSQRIFDKRLEVYEGLMSQLDKAAKNINTLIETTEGSKEEKIQIAFEAGLEILEYAEKYQLYINNDIIFHIGATFVNPKEIFELESGKEKDYLVNHFREEVQEAKLMIKNESGIGAVEKLFQSIIKASHKSPVLDYYRELKKNRKN